MVVVQSYALAVVFSFITMLCWGSWANTQKLAGKEWRFELFYWDYVLGIVLLALVFALTLGNFGGVGRPFFADLAQASPASLLWALGGGIVFNAANILFVVAIDLAGMAVAFPVAIGLALVIGVFFNYLLNPVADPLLLGIGVLFILVAIILDSTAYRRLPRTDADTSTKVLVISLIAGVLMGFWYPVWAKAISLDFVALEAGQLGPYAGFVLLAVGVLLSNIVFNTLLMKKPVTGEPASYAEYFGGSGKVHMIGILGGIIWAIGSSFNIIASGEASFAISYGLGQSAPMIGALWGIFAWKEFEDAPAGTNTLLTFMFLCFLVGLGFIIYARV